LGIYGPDEYFKNLYPDWFRETSLFEALFFIFLFFLLMSAFYVYIRYFERRTRMIIDNTEQEIGREIDYGLYGKDLGYTFMIRKLNETDWIAYKLYRSGRKLSLRKGDLMKIIDYMNRNFGFDDEIVGFD
jgi:hypothetical protein